LLVNETVENQLNMQNANNIESLFWFVESD